MLKGCSDYLEREIDEFFDNNIKCFTAKTTRISKEDSPYPVYRVLVTGMTVNLAYLRHNFSLLGRLMITWQAVRKECNHGFQWVKCAGNHSPGQCKRNSRDDGSVPLKCANCKGNHTANYTECESRKATWVEHKKPQDETIKSIPQLPQYSKWGAGKPNTAVNAPEQDRSEPNKRLTRLFTEKITALQNTIKEMQLEIDDTLRSELSQTKLQQQNTTKPTGVSEIAGRLFSDNLSSSPSANFITWNQNSFFFQYNDARFL